MRTNFLALALSLALSAPSYALVLSRSAFCQDQESLKIIQSRQKIQIQGELPHPALLATISTLMDEFFISGPLKLHFTKEEGPRKVWSQINSEGKHVYFSRNSIDLLLGIELEKVAQEVCAPGWSGSKTFTIEYTNTVMEQFLRSLASREGLKKFLNLKTGWSLRSLPNESHYLEEQEFRTDELVTLVKQFADLPKELFQRMKLRKLTRWRTGAQLPNPEARAMYFVEEQKILLGDGALLNDYLDLYGEGTILHEMGHAYWFGADEAFRHKFSELSWRRIGDRWETKLEESTGFVTTYAMSSPEEDFAEHFSAYVHRPEFIKDKARIKYSFLQKQVFTDTAFFSTVAPNAKVFITSPVPDTTGPWLEKSFPFSYRASVKVPNPASSVAEIDVEITGARDDISGIASTLFTFEQVENDRYSVGVKLNPHKMPDGSFGLKGSVVTDPRKLASGVYMPTTLALKDLAGNTKYYEALGLPKIELPGFLKLLSTEKPPIDMSKITIEAAPVIQGHHGVILTLPLGWEEGLEHIQMHWEFTRLEATTVNVCNTGRKNYAGSVPCFLTQNKGEPIKLQAYFYKEYTDSLVKLASFSLHYSGNGEAGRSVHDYPVPVYQENASFHLKTGNSQLPLLDLDVNRMKLKAVSGANSEGGDQSIEVSIPLLNRSAGNFKLHSTVRSPTGKYLDQFISEDFERDHKVVKEGGADVIKFKIHLKKNPEEGEYMLEGFTLTTEYPRPKDPHLPLDQNELTKRKIKLLERGIRKSFTITDEKISNLR